jgi:Kef-type K+ transport system membrane component KefB
MDTAFIFAAFVGTLYAILAFARNHLTESKKAPKDLFMDTLSVFGLVIVSHYLLDSFGYASICALQKGDSTKAFTSNPDF